jgi:chromate transporter
LRPTASSHGRLAFVPYREAVRVWLRVAALSFGGPAGQIAVMHRILVEEKRWIGERRFLHAFNYCMLLPGPEAQQLATYIGWLMHGYRGGLTAGLLFVLPGFVSILALSLLYVSFRGTDLVTGLFFGLKAAVLAIVVQALVRIGRRVLVSPFALGVAGASFLAIFIAAVPFPAIVVGAGLLGLVAEQVGARTPEHAEAAGSQEVDSGLLDAHLAAGGLAHTTPSLRRAATVVAVCGLLWLAPFAVLDLLPGGGRVYLDEAAFFSKAALVTFGGAYAVLSYIAQAAVESYGWLQPGEMLDGLGMAETTPGPLIQVVQFVGFMGAYRQAGPLDPLVAGVIGSVVTTWVTFVPCFLWVFVGGPYVESLRANRRLTMALAAITAAVAGVILNLALWFALHTFFAELHELWVAGLQVIAPRWASVDIPAVALAGVAFLALFRWRVGLPLMLAGSAALGWVTRLLIP